MRNFTNLNHFLLPSLPRSRVSPPIILPLSLALPSASSFDSHPSFPGCPETVAPMIRERRNGSGGELFSADGGSIVDRRSGNGVNGFADHSYNSRGCDDRGSTLAVPSSSLPPPASPLQHKSPSHSGYIQHSVSKYDTLAGVAIRYGVEVADIKRLNGLVSDIQMFALKTLHIPLPGRHPPSTCLPNGSDASRDSSHPHTPTHNDPFDSFQSLRIKSSRRKASPAMNSLHGLQGYYGINSDREEPRSQVLDMADYRIEDEPDRGSSENLVRRRQKSDADFNCAVNSSSSPNNNSDSSIQEKASLREENGSPPTISLRTSSSSSKMNGGGGFIPILMIGIGDSFIGDMKKSLSTPSLQDQETGLSLSSLWPTSKWSLKPDLQAFSAAAIPKPILDGLPKQIAAWRNKTAVD